jgi:hypothetical protein
MHQQTITIRLPGRQSRTITMENNSPPLYSIETDQGPSQNPAAIEADALLDQLTKRVNEQHVLGEEYPPEVQTILDRETERIRNMLEFTLAIDYQGYASASMSAADREHFMHIGKALRQLSSTVVRRSERPAEEVRPNPQERQVLAAYFWKYLFEPCKALSLPLDFVYGPINYLGRYADARGFYKGSVFGLAQQYGLENLAAKLYWDRHVLIPLIFTDYTARNRMLHGVDEIQNLYFLSIDGVESSTVSDANARNFMPIHSVKYEVNERGMAYACTRKTTIARARKEMSTKHWMKAAGSCVDGVLARFKLVKDGKRKPDCRKPTWRGENTEPPHRRQYMDAAVPSGWLRLSSYHVPDYCEFRDQVLKNDC